MTIEYEALVGPRTAMVRYTVDGTFTDALHFQRAEFDAQTAQTLEAEMQRRFDEQQAVIESYRSPTPEQTQAQIDWLVSQQNSNQEQLLALVPDEAVLSILQQQAADLAEQISTVSQLAVAPAQIGVKING